jgi:signal transduction histidine kinase
MRIPAAAATVPLLLLLLTLVLVRSVNTGAERFDRALGTLDDFAMVENALRRDVLAARAGLLRNYDPLVREVGTLRGLLGRLQEVAGFDTSLEVAIDDLSASVVRQEELVEEFKSNNALLQNSLAYFGLFSSQFGSAEQDAALAADVGALAASVLHLTLDTSPGVVRDAEQRLDELARRAAAPGDTETLKQLLAHGRMLRDLLPATDDLLKTLFSLQITPQQTAIRAAVVRHQIASRDQATDYRILLYAISVVLLGLLIHLGLQLRARALALRRRAAFEHLIAGISMRFITARRQQIGEQIEQALGELAVHLGADRAYVVFAGPSRRRHVWTSGGIAGPPNWPDRALALSRHFHPNEDGVIHIRRVNRLPAGPERDALTAAGLQGWVCISGRGADGTTDILGFDALQASAMTRSDQLGLLRMAFDAIANAVGRDHLERERGRLEERLQQARRMETVGALASGIAHNFNNIVGAILGYTEMAEAQVKPDSRPAGNLSQIRRAGERARDLVDQILAYGRRRATSRQPTNIQALVAEAVSLLRASLPKTVELVTRQPEEPAVVSGEPAQLQQVILNLSSNAAQAMDGTGRIDIDITLQEVERMRMLTHGTLMPGPHIRIAVADSGRGIDADALQQIFEPFFTLRQDGNGLGLATVREIVREHGGAIEVWSKPGVGSRFEVWLPRAAEAGPAARDDGITALPLGRGEAVLLVHDDRKLLLRDEELVAALGYEPVGFAAAADALAAFRLAPERFDAAIVSQCPSLGSGLDIAAELHAVAPALPILLAVSSTERVDADALAVAGISEVVRRPLGSTNISTALRSLRPEGRQLTDAPA